MGMVPYAEAWALQRALAAHRASGALTDTLLLLEHPPVYTAGRNTQPAHLRGSVERLRNLGADFHEVDRGGSVTFHGPGQLVAYPIVCLREVFAVPGAPAQGDVVRYLRALEQALVLCAAELGVAAGPRPPFTGLWAGDRKLAAIGVKLAAGGVTQHGAGLNVCNDLSWFGHVVPCGIHDSGVGSLVEEGAEAGLRPGAVAPVLAACLATVLGRTAEPIDAAQLRRGATAPAPGAPPAALSEWTSHSAVAPVA